MAKKDKAGIGNFILLFFLFLVIILGAYALSKDIVNTVYDIYLFLDRIYNDFLHLFNILNGLSKL